MAGLPAAVKLEAWPYPIALARLDASVPDVVSASSLTRCHTPRAGTAQVKQHPTCTNLHQLACAEGRLLASSQSAPVLGSSKQPSSEESPALQPALSHVQGSSSAPSGPPLAADTVSEREGSEPDAVVRPPSASLGQCLLLLGRLVTCRGIMRTCTALVCGTASDI